MTTPECSVASTTPQTLFLYKVRGLPHPTRSLKIALDLTRNGAAVCCDTLRLRSHRHRLALGHLRSVEDLQQRRQLPKNDQHDQRSKHSITSAVLVDGIKRLTVQGRLLLQVLTLSMVSLTKSCLRAIDCTEDAELGHATLDAMPDVLCDWQSRSFKMQKGLAITLMLIYDILVPWGLFSVLALAQDSGRINEPEFRQAHGWYLQKYHADAWYAELVFVFYRIAMSSCAVMLSSRANASLCLVLMGLVTAAMLAFVLSVKPFNDNEDDRPSEEAMTSADRKQAWALGATVAATLVGFGCAQTKDRGEGMDAAIAALITCIGAAPILVGLYEKYKDHKANKDDTGDNEEEEDGVYQTHLPPNSSDLHTFLEDANLASHADGLAGIGATAVHDLHYVEDTDLVSIGLKKSEVARFRRKLAEHAEGRQNATENPLQGGLL